MGDAGSNLMQKAAGSSGDTVKRRSVKPGAVNPIATVGGLEQAQAPRPDDLRLMCADQRYRHPTSSIHRGAPDIVHFIICRMALLRNGTEEALLLPKPTKR